MCISHLGGLNQNAIYEILKPLAFPSVVDILGVNYLIDDKCGRLFAPYWKSTSSWREANSRMMANDTCEDILVLIGLARGVHKPYWNSPQCYLLCFGIFSLCHDEELLISKPFFKTNMSQVTYPTLPFISNHMIRFVRSFTWN